MPQTRRAWLGASVPGATAGRTIVAAGDELRVLVSTDVLSEGQNLQDCAIVVNYDLPWAIIRLIQRAGRVDRIGQQAPDILCYSFLPAEGIERLIRLRERVRTRLRENAEVVGTDEAFFEDEDAKAVLDLYNEKAGILDAEDDSDVDLASYAYQIWRNATEKDASLKRTIENLPPVVHASKAHPPQPRQPAGALVYVQTAQGYDALAWMDPRRQQRDPEPVRHPACCRLRPRHAGPAASRHPPRPGTQRSGARRPRGKAGRRATRPAVGRPLPHLRTPQGSCRRRQGHAVRHRAAAPRHRRHLPLSPTPDSRRYAEPASCAAACPTRRLPSWSSRCGTKTACASSMKKTNARSRVSSVPWV